LVNVQVRGLGGTGKMTSTVTSLVRGGK